VEIRTPSLLLACAFVVFAGCKQKSKEEAEPPPKPSAAAPPAETASSTPPPSDIIPPPTPPPVTPVAAPKIESIKACCAALHKEESSAQPAQKSMYTQAATSCYAISKLVAAGTTKKSAALTQLRASLKGGKLPAGCD